MCKKNFPIVIEKNSEKILPLISAKCDNEGNIIEVEVWRDDDIFYLQKGEFEIMGESRIYMGKTIEETMECYEDCPRQEQFIRLARESITIEEVDKLYRFLQGEVPENINMKRPPRLSRRQANELFDTYQEGNADRCHCDYCRKD